MTNIDEVLRDGTLHSALQPIVDLDSGAVVAYEALARGPQGDLATAGALFAAARSAGRLGELDAACRRAALRAAVDHGVADPLWLFVNVEPEVLDQTPLEGLLAIADGAPGGLRVVLEITERALSARPAELHRPRRRSSHPAEVLTTSAECWRHRGGAADVRFGDGVRRPGTAGARASARRARVPRRRGARDRGLPRAGDGPTAVPRG